MKRNNKKGFTIIELVIVIAVIAILAAVLIPTFSSIIKKANTSADIQACYEMNTTLALCIDAPASIADAKFALSENDIDANNYKPLSTGYDYYWVPSLNRVILVDEDEQVVYPTDIATNAKNLQNTWYSLSGSDNSEDVKKITDQINANSTTITLNDTNFYGASINLDVSKTSAATITIGGSDSNNPATLTNMVSDEGSKVNAGKDTEYAGHSYYCGLINQVPNGKTVTVENLIIDGAVIGDTTNPNSARCGIIAGDVYGTLNIKNVTIKNCTVFGAYRVGALIGHVGSNGTVNITNVTVENTTVKGGTITAALIGGTSGTVKYSNVTVTNVTTECSKFNTGVDNLSYETKSNGDKFLFFSGYGYCAYITDKYAWVEVAKGTYNNTLEDHKYYASSDDITNSQ